MPAELPTITSRSIRSRTDLLLELAAVRERGYATEDGEIVPGRRCVAIAARLAIIPGQRCGDRGFDEQRGSRSSRTPKRSLHSAKPRCSSRKRQGACRVRRPSRARITRWSHCSTGSRSDGAVSDGRAPRGPDSRQISCLPASRLVGRWHVASTRVPQNDRAEESRCCCAVNAGSALKRSADSGTDRG